MAHAAKSATQLRSRITRRRLDCKPDAEQDHSDDDQRQRLNGVIDLFHEKIMVLKKLVSKPAAAGLVQHVALRS